MSDNAIKDSVAGLEDLNNIFDEENNKNVDHCVQTVDLEQKTEKNTPATPTNDVRTTHADIDATPQWCGEGDNTSSLR